MTNAAQLLVAPAACLVAIMILANAGIGTAQITDNCAYYNPDISSCVGVKAYTSDSDCNWLYIAFLASQYGSLYPTATCRQTFVDSNSKLCAVAVPSSTDDCSFLSSSTCVAYYQSLERQDYGPCTQLTSSPGPLSSPSAPIVSPSPSPAPEPSPLAPPAPDPSPSPSPAPAPAPPEPVASPAHAPNMGHKGIKKASTNGTHSSTPQSAEPDPQVCRKQSATFYVFVVLPFALIAVAMYLAVVATWPRGHASYACCSWVEDGLLDVSMFLAGIGLGVIGIAVANCQCWPDMLVLYTVVYLAAAAGGSGWLWLMEPVTLGNAMGGRRVCKMLVRFLSALGPTIGVVLAAVGILQQTDPSTACSIGMEWNPAVCGSQPDPAGPPKAKQPAGMISSLHLFIGVCMVLGAQTFVGVIGMIWQCVFARRQDTPQHAAGRMAALCLGVNALCVLGGIIMFGAQTRYLNNPSPHFSTEVAAVVALALMFIVLVACLFRILAAKLQTRHLAGRGLTGSGGGGGVSMRYSGQSSFAATNGAQRSDVELGGIPVVRNMKGRLGQTAGHYGSFPGGHGRPGEGVGADGLDPFVVGRYIAPGTDQRDGFVADQYYRNDITEHGSDASAFRPETPTR